MVPENQEMFSRLCDFFGLTEALAGPSEETAAPSPSSTAAEPPEAPAAAAEASAAGDDNWEMCALDGFTPEVTEALKAEREALRQVEAELVDLEMRIRNRRFSLISSQAARPRTSLTST